MSGPDPGVLAALPVTLREAVAAGTARVSDHPIPGLPAGTVFRVLLEGIDHPQQTYVGRWPDGTARLLPDDQSAFAELAAAVGARIPDADTALGYVLGFLEVTRGPGVLVRVVDEVAQIRWRPGTAEEEQRRSRFLSTATVEPPRIEPTEDGSKVDVWLIVDQRIQLNTFDVSTDGAITATFRVVARDLPLPIAR